MPCTCASKKFSPSSVSRFAVLIGLLTSGSVLLAAAQSESIVHRFTTDGAYPQCTLVADKLGNLYGTTEDGGTDGSGIAFELTPPTKPGGSWTETILHQFSNLSDGQTPFGGLTFDKAGNLFGAAIQGGGENNYGTVFELSPPAKSGGTWTFTLIANFNSGNNADVAINPSGPLVFDGQGDLYGVSEAGIPNSNCGMYLCGNVFELQPPVVAGGAWTGKSLYNFETNGTDDGIFPSNVQLGPGGTLYGTTINGGTTGVGTLYKLTPPATSGGAWTEKILFSFAQPNGYPSGGLLADGEGGYFGTAENYGESTFGSVFHLNPPSGGKGWTESILYNFTGGSDGSYPDGVISDGQGNLYGVAIQGGVTNGKLCLSGGCGTVFELSPPDVSGGAWTETTLHDFAGGNDGGNPNAHLLLLKGSYFGVTTYSGTTKYSGGTVFRVTP